MDVYSYRYKCNTWYYLEVSGIRNFYSQDSVEPKLAALDDARKFTGSKECDVELLQRFKMTVTDVETFPAMATQPLHLYQTSRSN